MAIKDFIAKHNDVIIQTGRNLFILAFLFLLLDLFSIADVKHLVNLDILFYVGIGSGTLAFTLWSENQNERRKKIINNVSKYSFLFFLFLVTLSNLRFEFMSSIAAFLQPFSLELTIGAIVFGFLTFYFNREVIDTVEKEHDEEQKAEDKRKKEFSKKFSFFAKFDFDYGIMSNWKKRNYFTLFLRFLLSPFIAIGRLPFVFVRWMYKEGFFYSIALIIIFVCYLAFGLHHLGQFMTVDEPKWLFDRVPQLYESIASGDWRETYINDKPGILPAFLSGIGGSYLNWSDYGPLNREVYLYWWRLPILLFNLFMLAYIYHFLKKLLDKNHALLTVGLLSLNPILVGISQIVNPDATLWSTSALSFITLFLYLKTNKEKYAIYSGIFFGLALISKYFATFYYVIFFAIICLEYLTSTKKVAVFYERNMNLMKIYCISILIYFIALPATWIDIDILLGGTINNALLSKGYSLFLPFVLIIFSDVILFKGKIKHTVGRINPEVNLLRVLTIFSAIFFIFLFSNNVLLGFRLFNFDYSIFHIYELAENDILSRFISSGYFTFFSLTIPLLIGTFFSLILLIKKPKENLLVISLLLLIYGFIVGASIGGFIALTRYQVMFFFACALLTSLVFLSFRIYHKLIIISVLVVSLISILVASPYYFTYNNALNIHHVVVNEAWGLGGYELAQEFNRMPNAENITVWVDREGFDIFFVGKSYWRGKDNPFTINDQIDYLILTDGGKKIYLNSLNDYERGSRDLYAVVAGVYNILDYYNYTPQDYFCVNHNSYNCIRSIKFQEESHEKQMLSVNLDLSKSLTQHQKVLTIGDSITYGVCASNKSGYRGFLKGDTIKFVGSISDGTYFHEGHKGWKTNDVQTHITELMQEFDPDIIVINIGTNNAKDDTHAAIIADQIIDIVSTIRRTNIETKIILTTLLPRLDKYNEKVQLVNEELQENGETLFADDEKVQIVDLYQEFSNGNLSALFCDNEHPNDNGYMIIGKALEKVIS